MWAEITLRCKGDLPANLTNALRSRFDDQTDLATAINSSFLKNNAAIASLVIFPQISSSRILLVFKPESRTLKMHVEAALRKESLRVLKREIEGIINEIEGFINLHKNKVNDVQIVIGGNDDEIMIGNKTAWFVKIKQLMLEDVVIKLIVPIVTYLVSTIMNQEPTKALINAVVAICALILFTTIKSFILPKYEYKEV